MQDKTTESPRWPRLWPRLEAFGLALLGLGLWAPVGCLFLETFAFARVLGFWRPLMMGVVAVAVIWLVLMIVKPPGLRIFLRALVAAIAFTPFIQNSGAQWSTPLPPASFSAALSLSRGNFADFQIWVMIAVTFAAWLGGFSLHRARQVLAGCR